MSEELYQRDLYNNPEKIGKWDYYSIGATTVKKLKEYGIIRNVDYGDIERKKVDGIIVYRKNVIAIIEFKTPAEFRTKTQQAKAIKQEFDVAKKLGCKLLIATDTTKTIWINVLSGDIIEDENGNHINFNFNPKDEKLVSLIEKIRCSITSTNNRIKPQQLINPTDLAKQIWQDVWSVSGATPENCLYTFVELFIFKYLSDLNILKGVYSFDHIIDLYNVNSSDEVLETYATTIRKKIKDLFHESPIDKTTIINGTVFVSKDQKAVKGYSSVFKKILFKFRDYGKLENIDFDFKSQLFESFLKQSISKKNWGQFFTPLKVVRAIVQLAKDEIKDGISICDPACGVGKFLLEPIASKLNQFYEINSTGITPKITIHGFDKGFDKEEQKTIILAKANMLIYFSDLIKDNINHTKDFANLFNDSFILKTNSILGTLSDPVNEEYDLILTNPPYVTSGSSNLKDEIRKDGELLRHYTVNALGVEGLFMEWIIRALKPGRKAFIIIPDGMLNRFNDKSLRRFIVDECYIDGLISLPLDTFFATNKKTYILCITKKINKTQKQKDPVFTYLVSEIGETRDVYRFDIDQNDLEEAVTLFSFFKGNKSEFSKFNTDKRCKIVPANFFFDNIEKNWIIDNLWTQEEKIELGIIDKIESVDLFGFSSIIDEVASNMKNFQEEIKSLAEKKKDESTIKLVKLKDLFDSKSGISKYTKKYGNSHKGNYPVYSASNKSALTNIDTFDYNGEFLTWATNGFAGYMKIISGKFSINADRGILTPKRHGINIYYVKNKIEPTLRNIAKGRKGENGEDEFTKVYPSMIDNIDVPMPINSNGEFDEIAQNDIVEKYQAIDDIRKKISDYRQQIHELTINIEPTENAQQISITDNNFFHLLRGKRITKKTAIQYPGNIPVYSSSKDESNVLAYIDESYLTKNNLILLDKPSVLFNLDGSVGHCFIREDNKYSFIDVVASLRPKVNDIDLEFLLYELRNEINKTGADYRTKLYFNKIRNYNISISIPIDSNGNFDLLKQKEIADTYRRIDEIKKFIDSEFEKLSRIHINI